MKRKTKNIIKILLLVVVVLVAGLAIFMSYLNPSQYDHLNALDTEISKYDMSQLNLTEEEQAQYNAYMSSGVNTTIMRKVVKNLFRVEDYGIFSVGYIKGKDIEKKVSFGIFNNVTISDADQLPQDILKAYRSINSDTTATTASGEQQQVAQ